MENTIILAIASPILITVGGIITWLIKSKKKIFYYQRRNHVILKLKHMKNY